MSPVLVMDSDLGLSRLKLRVEDQWSAVEEWVMKKPLVVEARQAS